jgi:hypothetical protein
MMLHRLPVLWLLLASPLVHAAELSFERDVRPILKSHCFQCHGEAGVVEGQLDLRLARLMIRGGESGPAIAPGHAADSRLLARIKSGEMPPKGAPLPAKDVAVLEAWIASGAKTAAPEPDDVQQLSDITDEERNYWAFRPIARPAMLTASNPTLVQSPIDAFLLAKLDAEQLTFAPPAERRTLIRRLSYDLRGLPPRPDEVDEYLADDAPDADARLIERFLASPHYGERWGRHWLDAAGYADSDGYTEKDPERPYAWKYRDYVIRSHNANKPFDQFLVEQLAGDELVPPPYANLSADDLDKLIATGFLRTVADGTASGVAVKEAGNAVMTETLKVVSTSLLGLTVGCAECHNHRYDPITQVDYYRLRAIFEPAYNWKAWRAPAARRVSLYTDADRAKAAEIEAEAKAVLDERQKKLDEFLAATFEKQVEKIPEEKRELARAMRALAKKDQTPEHKELLKAHPNLNVNPGTLYLYDPKAANELKEFDKKVAEIRATKPVEDFIDCLTEVTGQNPETVLFHRGDVDQPKQPVTPGELTVLASFAPTLPVDDESLPTTGRRLAYARHLTGGRHPLVARVIVNRVWMHHFGRGLVGSTGDFGVLGERPTHPELLDWLAAEFVDSGWDLKQLHRLILTSTAYRQSTAHTARGDTVDPDNRLLSRQSIRRLEAESVRDALLVVSGQFYDILTGKPVPVMEDDVGQFIVGVENKDGEAKPGAKIPLHGEEFRRSVYVQVRRSRPLGVMEAFDLPTLEPNCTSRATSTVAPQSLMLMNNEFTIDAARQLAQRLADDAGADPTARVQRVWRLVFSRAATETEATAAARFIDQQTTALTAVADAESDPKKKIDPAAWAWTTLCQSLLSANEFLYVD